ncbi:LuxR family transcriptional regulator [Pelagibius sp. Alg239-R121]|uniref:LuxR family transcriptional regulator n=1 Tax=Pelagibius sp. Alg239-R121 TaxID=2993448 RepID=UPI0024A6ECAE|nr:autoinducer binding domain-containing protein [Pelagibius sp. Alg239-R121]
MIGFSTKGGSKIYSLWNISEKSLDACGNLDAVGDSLAEVAADLGLPFFSYLLVRPGEGLAKSGSDVLITNYAPEWCTRYQHKLYKHYDPVALIAGRSRLPFFWDSGSFLRPFRKDQRRVFHEGRTFNIACGYSIPIAGPDGDVGVFSVVASRDGHLTDAVKGAGGDIYVSAIHAHDRVMRLLSDDTDDHEDVRLSAREIECLKWTAEGMTTNAIAETISISPATVNYHLNKAIRKLEASNRHHAAIKAIRAGLI